MRLFHPTIFSDIHDPVVEEGIVFADVYRRISERFLIRMLSLIAELFGLIILTCVVGIIGAIRPNSVLRCLCFLGLAALGLLAFVIVSQWYFRPSLGALA